MVEEKKLMDKTYQDTVIVLEDITYFFRIR